MRIPCPHCGPRTHDEFTYYGDATVRRPRRPVPTQSLRSTTMCTRATILSACTVNSGSTRAAATSGWSSSATRATTTSRAPCPHGMSSPPGRRSEFAPGTGRCDQSPADVPFQLRRQGLHRLRRRLARVGPARQRRAAGRAFVQVSPSPRHAERRPRRAERTGRAAQRCPPRTQHACDGGRTLRRPRSHQPEPLAFAAVRRAGDQRPVLAAVRGRVLLQDVHVARLLLGEGVRTDDPSCRRSRPCSARSRPGPLREELGALRRAHDRRRACGPGGCA